LKINDDYLNKGEQLTLRKTKDVDTDDFIENLLALQKVNLFSERINNQGKLMIDSQAILNLIKSAK